MYLLIKQGHAIVVDPCKDYEALSLLKRNQISELLILLTHEHYDHISGVNWLKSIFSCQIFASKNCSRNIVDPRKNASFYFNSLLLFRKDPNASKKRRINSYSTHATLFFEDSYSFEWFGHKISLIETPGHSQGSTCILFDDKVVFTGDSLIKNSSVVTRLPGGSKKDYDNITKPFLQNLRKNTLVLPGHGPSGIIEDFAL